MKILKDAINKQIKWAKEVRENPHEWDIWDVKQANEIMRLEKELKYEKVNIFM